LTQFEYVTTLASFIVAFGVSRVLAGWVHQFVRRRETPIYPLQLAIVGASALINPPPGHPSSIRDYYFDVRKAVFGLCAAWIILGGIFDVVGTWIVSLPLNPDLPYGFMFSIRGVALLVFAFMAWSDRESHHWAGFIVAALIPIGWIPGVSYHPSSV